MSSNQTNSTLAEQEQEMELKTLITAYIQVDAPQPAANEATDIILDLAPVNTASATGPLETQLLSLLTSIRSVEHSRPTIMAIDHARLQNRITVLEAETQGLQVRYHALQALRVNDLSNLLCIREQLAASRHETTTIRTLRSNDFANILSVRDQLAAARRQLTALRELRENDFRNVQELREKLAKATWTRPKMERAESASTRSSLRMSMSLRDGAGGSGGMDLWQVAKAQAMEHRILELEEVNGGLKAQLDALRNQGVEAVLVKTVKDESEFKREGLGALLEDVIRVRERTAVAMERVRVENANLRREAGVLEDKNAELEDTVNRLRCT